MGLSGIKETPKIKHSEASLEIPISNVLSLKMLVLVRYWGRGKGGGGRAVKGVIEDCDYPLNIGRVLAESRTSFKRVDCV